MELTAGKRLGPYEILSAIGAGGMGEVHRALDIELKREVAIKILPEAFAHDPERLARFRLEAQVLASLNHSNIAGIYGLQESGGFDFLVMELAPGKNLQDRLAREGPLPVEDCLAIGKQIAEALEAAHEKGITHRDLKPANIMVTPEGKVKVLDFGLAKAFVGDSAGDVVDANSPTVTRIPTTPGVILGTAAYMSPEQAKGKRVDPRTDIWALGCVLYELLTGKRAFAGDSVSETLGAIHYKEPDWQFLPPATPQGLRALLRRCLQKDPNRRYHHAADVRIEIEEIQAASVPVTALPAAPAVYGIQRRWILMSALACVIFAAFGGIVVWLLRPVPAANSQQVLRTVIPVPENEQGLPAGFVTRPILAVSPDGRMLAYVANNGNARPQISVRALNELEARPLLGTVNASMPFFSPDGQWIGFTANGALRKVPITGGGTLTVTGRIAGAMGASWGPPDTIVFSPNPGSGLWKVSAAGGEAIELTKLKGAEQSHRWPQFLPDGNAVLFTVLSGASSDGQEIAVKRLDTGEEKVLIRGGTYPQYVPTGHLLFYRAGTVLAVPFDPVRLEIKGTPVPVVEGVRSTAGNGIGGAQVGFSRQGTVIYSSGTADVAVGAAALSRLVWVDRQGVEQTTPASPHVYKNPLVSPDGRLVAIVITDPMSDVWIYDLGRDTLTRLTFEGSSDTPFWSPDGKRVVFEAQRGGPVNLFWKPVDGSGSEERLTRGEYTHQVGSLTPDAKTLIYAETHPKTQRDLWMVRLDGDRKPQILLQTPFNESTGRLSPDGHWLAYISDESGRYEVYVRPFPGPGGKWQISTEGGNEVLWSPKGNELFYWTGNRMMAVDISTQPAFSAGKPRMLFEATSYLRTPGAGIYYSVSPDAQRFLMLKRQDQKQTGNGEFTVIANWFEELKAKVPVTSAR
jgi:eukaryotic-like serine/threonine-protein kinase